MANYSRRDFAKLALMAVPAAGLLSYLKAYGSSSDVAAKPNSTVKGVQIGINVPYSFGNIFMSGDETLANVVALGVSFVELRAQPVEQFLGCPVYGKRKLAAGDKAKMQAWRESVTVEKATAFRNKWNDAGVTISVLKVDDIYAMSDAELNYFFALAKTLGAGAISCEMSILGKEGSASINAKDLKRIGSFADKHQIRVGYHGHTAVTEAMWEAGFDLAKFNGANLDIGHFIAGNNYSPVAFMKKHYDKITHIHLKDRTLHDGPNTEFGKGDTPIVEILRLIRDNKWPIMAAIEFEYKVPQGSTRMAEIAKCVAYCRNALS